MEKDNTGSSQPAPENKEAKTAKKPAKKKTKKIGKPPAWLFLPAVGAAALLYRIKYNVHVDRRALRGEKGPAIVLAPHVSGMDHLFTAMGLYPRRPTYVLSEHFHANKKLRWVLEYINTITKKMFCPDARSVISMMRAIKEGNTVVLFPEGRLTWYGRSLKVTAGTAELVKQMGVTVFCITSYGAGRSFPKWAKFTRRGRIDVVTEKILSPEQIKSMTLEEVSAAIDAKILHDEEKAQPGVRFKTCDTSAGADGILWKCPLCGASYSLDAAAGHICCRECGLDVTLDEFGAFSDSVHLDEKNIQTVADWYEFCAGTVDITQPLVMDVTLSGTDADGYMQRGIGKGVFTISSESLSFEGEIDGKPDAFSISTSKVAGFPVTVGDHVDLYRSGRLLWIEPAPDRRRAIELVAYLEKVHK